MSPTAPDAGPDGPGPPVGAMLVLRAASGRGDDLADLVARLVRVTRERHGPRYFGAGRLAADPEVLVVFEEWPDQRSVQAHMAAPEYRTLTEEAGARGLVASAEGALQLAPLFGSPLWGARLDPVDPG